MKAIFIGVITLTIIGMFTPQVKAMEIKVTDAINLTDRNVRVEEMVVEASNGNKEITVDRAENNVPNRNMQNDRGYEPIDCFGNLNKPRRN